MVFLQDHFPSVILYTSQNCGTTEAGNRSSGDCLQLNSPTAETAKIEPDIFKSSLVCSSVMYYKWSTPAQVSNCERPLRAQALNQFSFLCEHAKNEVKIMTSHR